MASRECGARVAKACQHQYRSVDRVRSQRRQHRQARDIGKTKVEQNALVLTRAGHGQPCRAAYRAIDLIALVLEELHDGAVTRDLVVDPEQGRAGDVLHRQAGATTNDSCLREREREEDCAVSNNVLMTLPQYPAITASASSTAIA